MARTVTFLDSDPALAAQIGIPVPVLRAIRAVESSGSASAIRFEPHVFLRARSDLADRVPYTPGPNGPSLTRSETDRAAFERAFQLDPEQAVRSTSWGAFQVMGGLLLRIVPDPVQAVIFFRQDPVGMSDRLLAAWFETRPAARDAAATLDFDTFANAYNGPRARERGYATRLEEAYRIALSGESSSVGWWALGLTLTASAGYGLYRWWRK